MNKADFLRIFPLRAPNIMWLLGAGSSAAAGIRTAGQMIWHFKLMIFCAEQRVSVRSCPDLGEASFRERLNRYFQSKGGYPAPGSDDEYSFYFEHAYPSEQDRRLYIDQMVKAGSPSHGHLALASLAKLQRLRVLWTTNFDRIPEDALVKAFGSTSAFTVATLDAPHLADQALSEGQRPVVVKLHGDFQSRKLKNTTEELQRQDGRLRRAMLTECRRQGLAVVGFSGRDDSVMTMLEQAVDNGHGYPGGLFWFHRPDGPPFHRVQKLIDYATSKNVDAHIIEAETFDELMLDLFLLMEDVPEEIKAVFAERRNRRSFVSVPPPGAPTSFPVIRLNALPVTQVPATCRLVECSIGGAGEVKEVVHSTGADVIVGRRQSGVICFGSDAEVRKAFGGHGITKLDLYAIEPRRLAYDSPEQGLLNEALCRALVRERPLGAARTRGGWKLYVLPSSAGDPRLAALKQAAGAITGTIPGVGLTWAEAILIRLERKLERNWLLFEPSVWVNYPELPEADGDAAGSSDRRPPKRDEAVLEFIRERSARRYNYLLTRLFDAWADLLVGPPPAQKATLKAFGIGDGIDAAFEILRVTAFSRRGGAK
jgi:NAD-dependent SIR2 family protein deacetylase